MKIPMPQIRPMTKAEKIAIILTFSLPILMGVAPTIAGLIIFGAPIIIVLGTMFNLR